MKNHRGGKRKGAGRKPCKIAKVALTVKIDPLLLDKLRTLCAERETSQAKQISEWIKDA